MTSKQWFTNWFGIGVPLYLASSVILAFLWHVLAAIFLLGILLYWIYQSAHTTCSRCSFYGTKTCGLPGVVSPFLTKKKNTFLSAQQIKQHFWFDQFIMILCLIPFFTQPTLLPLAILWCLGAWKIVYKPKKFHGLLHQLNK